MHGIHGNGPYVSNLDHYVGLSSAVLIDFLEFVHAFRALQHRRYTIIMLASAIQILQNSTYRLVRLGCLRTSWKVHEKPKEWHWEQIGRFPSHFVFFRRQVLHAFTGVEYWYFRQNLLRKTRSTNLGTAYSCHAERVCVSHPATRLIMDRSIGQCSLNFGREVEEIRRSEVDHMT